MYARHDARCVADVLSCTAHLGNFPLHSCATHICAFPFFQTSSRTGMHIHCVARSCFGVKSHHDSCMTEQRRPVVQSLTALLCLGASRSKSTSEIHPSDTNHAYTVSHIHTSRSYVNSGINCRGCPYTRRLSGFPTCLWPHLPGFTASTQGPSA
jgi:hypothetical protein